MARGWIKFDKNLPEKPEVWQIASELNLDPDAVVGKLMRVWTWFDENAVGCHAPSVTKKILERDVGVTGFCQAMINAGWMLDEDNLISLPNYDRHNGESAKQRALATERKAKQRTQDVTEMSRSHRDKCVTREEKTLLTPPTPSCETPKKKAQDEQEIPEFFKAEWDEYVQMRKEKRSKLTPTTVKRLLKKLAQYPPEVARAMLLKSVEKGWTGVFGPEDGAVDKNTIAPRTAMSDDKWNVHNMKGDAR
jgi:hypothetical protein